MAKGFKDWDVPVSISAQEISQVTTRPKYGAAQLRGTTQFIDGGESKILHSITGRGVVYGGFIKSSSTVTKREDRTSVIVDGITLAGRNFLTLKDWNILKPLDDILHLLKYDDVGFIYVMGLMPGMTFESSLSYTYFGVGPDTATVSSWLTYALVT